MAKNYDHLFKVLLIGDPAVGKTCILCRFANDEFKTTHLSTIGMYNNYKYSLSDQYLVRFKYPYRNLRDINN